MTSIIQLRSRNTSTGYPQAEYDAVTYETIIRNAAVNLDDDFTGPGHTTIPTNGSPATGYPWVQRIQKTSGTPTAAIIANSSGGIVALALDATSEKQEASLYANDQRNWDVTKSATFECRAAFSVLPSAAAVEIVMGLMAAWIDGPDNNLDYVRFQANGSGLINVQSYDGTTTNTYASAVTLVASAFQNFRLDCTDPTNIGFYIDGVQVTTSTNIGFAATGTPSILQPYFSVYKASGTGVGTLQVDMVQLAMNRS